MNAAPLLRALSFASVKHRNQRRKDAESSPYINHPIAVASVLASEGGIEDDVLLIAGILHDTVEDTETTFEELAQKFGPAVASLVRELTDDKSLTKAERKLLQIEHARTASTGAKQLKIADKICNIRDITASPPADWPPQRRQEYLDWAAQVVHVCRGVNPQLEAVFDDACSLAKKTIDGLKE
jgi:guanosine-3',5'-bis(diphosphate) 3'-pyrophosphohydrolase